MYCSSGDECSIVYMLLMVIFVWADDLSLNFSTVMMAYGVAISDNIPKVFVRTGN